MRVIFDTILKTALCSVIAEILVPGKKVKWYSVRIL